MLIKPADAAALGSERMSFLLGSTELDTDTDNTLRGPRCWAARRSRLTAVRRA